MSVTVRLSGRPLTQARMTSVALMREVGLLARDLMIRRTQSGRDAEGHAFRPYSAEYRTLKQRALGSASPVNLEVSGRLLQSMRIVHVTASTVDVGYE